MYFTVSQFLFVLQQAEVRLKCLLGLQGIYSRKELVSRMDLFTNRFKVNKLLFAGFLSLGWGVYTGPDVLIRADLPTLLTERTPAETALLTE